MMIAGVLLAVWLYNSSYQESVAKGTRLTDEKLALERPALKKAELFLYLSPEDGKSK